ncbi:hypothetical protein [Spirillospora sp. CA-128828]|uniref:hypothetical protein n=1 Tax=Spirillospora sp. CA-128828 TaxID=3240033 RepID=UPI003D8D54D0
MPHATAYPAGLLLHVAIAARRGDLPDEIWWDLESAVFGHLPHRRRGHDASGLPDTVCRYGVRFPDGAKAATVADDPVVSDAEPSGPVRTSAGGGGGSGSEDTLESTMDLWPWPLPPEPFDFVVEWPVAGLPETGCGWTARDSPPRRPRPGFSGRRLSRAPRSGGTRHGPIAPQNPPTSPTAPLVGEGPLVGYGLSLPRRLRVASSASCVLARKRARVP